MNKNPSLLWWRLAGSEAARQIAPWIRVRLYEMRQTRLTLAHQTDQLAEIVCSNLQSDHRGLRLAAQGRVEAIGFPLD
jgi:folate-dependent tRNA-U54 methylase TrmFO/GidA